MSLDGWLVFALFWAVFVTTPGPNAVNCISNGAAFGFRKSLWGIAAILTQALAFLVLSAEGITALIAASPTTFWAVKLAGAGFLIWLGIRGWITASQPIKPQGTSARHIYWRALMIATFNIKSVTGYLAAFSQFVQPDVPIWSQMAAIVPTALTLTALSYASYTGLGVWFGRAALGRVLTVAFRRVMAVAFVIYGVLLGGDFVGGKA